jgi:hypothetical protein
MQSRRQVSVKNFIYEWIDRKDVCGNGRERLDFTKLYADLQKGIPLMSLIIIRDRDIAKKVCTALQH